MIGAIARAHQRGLQVLLFPIVWVETRSPGQWRGTLQPRNVDAWWRAYEHFIIHYARIAATTQAAWLSIGSELGSTETWRDRWFHLVGRLERIGRFKMLYSANWDHFSQVSFWRRIDAIGVNGYIPLTTDTNATEQTMTTAWAQAAANLTQLAKRTNKPLILTEVGYLSRDGAAVAPWNYTQRAALDLEEQRRAYAAFSAIWLARHDLSGVIFWDWNGHGGIKDRGYTPRGKPAEAVVRRFFRRRAN